LYFLAIENKLKVTENENLTFPPPQYKLEYYSIKKWKPNNVVKLSLSSKIVVFRNDFKQNNVWTPNKTENMCSRLKENDLIFWNSFVL